jgi:hypothetical protein
MKRVGRAVLAAALCAAALAFAAQAAIPTAEKIAGAIARSNDQAGRAKPLLIGVVLRISGGGASAEGEIATHPTGLARLELRSPQGFVERHLLVGDDYSASRDGERLESPHPFLPPIFLLQATSGAALEAALASFGVARDQVVLGQLGDHDCYVFGGRRPGGLAGSEQLLPSLWIDAVSYDPVRIVRTDGTEYRLGPVQSFDGIRLPGWIEIDTGSLRARLEIQRASKATAPAAAFGADWLVAAPPGE